MFDDARWSISFCCVLDTGRSVGVLVPERLDGVLAGFSAPATFGMDLLRFILSNSPPAPCGELRDGRKLLLFGVPAEPSPSMKRETKSLPGVSTNVEPALWLNSRMLLWFATTVAAIVDVCGGAFW